MRDEIVHFFIFLPRGHFGAKIQKSSKMIAFEHFCLSMGMANIGVLKKWNNLIIADFKAE